jgi:hypothetical protein
MSAPVAVRSNYSHLFGSSALPVLEEIFMSEMAQAAGQLRDKCFKKVSTDRDIWQSSEIHDMDLFNEIAEGSEYTYKRPKQGASKTLTVKKYGLGFTISEEMVEDGKFDLIGDMVRKLAKSGRESQELQAASIINGGFDTTTTADGAYLFSASHTLPSGLTFRNKPSSAVDLSVSSLDSALADFDTQFIGDSGIIYTNMAKVLLVHPSQKRYAMELIGSDLKADTADNNMNSLKGEGLVVVSSPHITDTDSWFLMGAPENTGLRIVVRKPLETKAAGPDAGFDTDSIKYKARYREIIGATHAYSVWGSQGV